VCRPPHAGRPYRRRLKGPSGLIHPPFFSSGRQFVSVLVRGPRAGRDAWRDERHDPHPPCVGAGARSLSAGASQQAAAAAATVDDGDPAAPLSDLPREHAAKPQRPQGALRPSHTPRKGQTADNSGPDSRTQTDEQRQAHSLPPSQRHARRGTARWTAPSSCFMSATTGHS
jgi:hypothetical protein